MNYRHLAAGAVASSAVAIAITSTTADARTRVSAAVAQTDPLRSRLVVEVVSTTRFTATTRPRAMTVRHRRMTYQLRHASATTRDRVFTVIWRTGLRRDIRALVGKRVAIRVRTASGMRTYYRRVGRARPRFSPPSRPVRGGTAFTRIARYFVSSQFVSAERRIHHCAGGSTTGRWEAQSSDASLRGTYRVIDAFQNTDGGWGVTYDVTLEDGGASKYTWTAHPDGRMFGGYADAQDAYLLTGFRWQQPAGC